jgi:hypothetical protein
MRRWFVAFTLIALCSTALRADVTMTTVTTLEGGVAALAGANMNPKMVMRIKGLKARTEIEVMGKTIVTLADLSTRKIVLLHPDEKTAQLIDATVPPPGAAAPNTGTLPKLDGTFKPTGRTQAFDGVSCDEYTFTMKIAMGDMASAPAPPEAAAMLQDMRIVMNGSVWMTKTAPGAAEYAAFQKTALDLQLASLITGVAAGISSNGMEKVMRGMSGGEGMPYLTQISMTVDGTGPGADMLKQMGTMKMTNKVTAVSTDAIPDEMFTVPADYTTVKQ